MLIMMIVIAAITTTLTLSIFPFLCGAGKSWPVESTEGRIAGFNSTLYPVQVYPAHEDISAEWDRLADEWESRDSFMNATLAQWLSDTAVLCNECGDSGIVNGLDCYSCIDPSNHPAMLVAIATDSRVNLNPIIDSDIDDFFSDHEWQTDRAIARQYGWEV